MRPVKVISVIFVLLLLAVGGTWVYFDGAAKSAMDPAATEEIVFEVPKGATLTKVGRLLTKEGFVKSDLVFKIYLKTHDAPAPKAGKHGIKKSMTLPQILVALSETPISEDVPLTMVEGWRLKDADAALAEKGLIEPGAYIKAASSKAGYQVPFELESETLAGYLLPETYMIPPGKLDARLLVQRQIDAFNKRFAQPYGEEIQRSGRSLRQIVIMASMLEREEPNPKNKPAVAGVLYNRLDKGHALGVDATSRFTLDDWNDRRKFLAKLRDPDDPYNTRLRTGLPPTPIGAPGVDSLVAALRPKKGPYWYYLHDAKANLHLSRNAKEHEAKRAKYNVY